jgi:hypothetical protein
MIRRFSENSSLENQALQIYQILVGCAHSRQIVTYGMIADLLKFGGAGVLDRQLGHIMFWCHAHDLPPLSVLVVNSGSGKPGVGLIKSEDFDRDREKVFSFDWFDVFPPTPVELKDAYDKGMKAVKQH